MNCCRCVSDDGDDPRLEGLGRVRFADYQTAHGGPVFHIASRTERKKNPSARFISAEIEVASVEADGTPVERCAKKWSASVVRDGSLPETGFEINTAPASGDLYVAEIEELCAALKQARAMVTASCGLHVHVDARDFSYYDIRRLVNVYAQIEPALFAMVSPTRRESDFCLPCGEKLKKAIAEGRLPYKKMKEEVLKSVYGEGNPQAASSKEGQRLRKRSKYCDARYAALNLHSWLYRGTVECRLFGGTVNAEKIISWGRMWATFLDYILARTDAEVSQELAEPVRTLESSILCLKKVVAGDEVLDRFITQRIERFAGKPAMKR